jgi:predicted CoA-substrate-specific enzyme activase
MFAGVDVGSVTAKALLLDNDSNILSFTTIPTTYDRGGCGREVFARCLAEAGVGPESVRYTVATGYGRKAVEFADAVLTEIVCHAAGTRHLLPNAGSIIDIGGQDSKVIEIGANGTVSKFQMNDKCAAGTGRFLEVLAERILNLSVEELGPLSLASETPCVLTSVCTVFAESEIISYLSEGRARKDIARGLHQAIAKRVVAMGASARIAYPEAVCFSGGVARNSGVARALEEALEREVLVPENPQMTASLGAALYGRKQFLQQGP